MVNQAVMHILHCVICTVCYSGDEQSHGWNYLLAAANVFTFAALRISCINVIGLGLPLAIT